VFGFEYDNLKILNSERSETFLFVSGSNPDFSNTDPHTFALKVKAFGKSHECVRTAVY